MFIALFHLKIVSVYAAIISYLGQEQNDSDRMQQQPSCLDTKTKEYEPRSREKVEYSEETCRKEKKNVIFPNAPLFTRIDS